MARKNSRGLNSRATSTETATIQNVPAAFCRYDAACAAACALVSLAVYFTTLGPTVTGEDSGELVAAAYTMGIPHPPGYPTWTMLGKLFTLVPYGTVAWRVNLMSAVFAAATVGLTFLLARRFSLPRWAAASGALVFGFSQELWEQAVIAEVYTLNAFFFAACLLLLLRWHERRDAASLIPLAALYGLSLGNHNTMALLGPVFAGFVLMTDKMLWRRWPLYLGAVVLAGGCAAAVHLYLPLRSLANPPVDWGNPETWDNFWAVVTRSQYSFMFTEDPRSLAQLGRQVGALLGNYLQQFSPWLGIAALPGLALLAWRDRVRGILLLLVMAWLTASYLLLLNTRMERETLWISTVFYIPSWLMMAVSLAAGLAWMGKRLQESRLSSWASRGSVALLGLLCIASPLWWNHEQNNRSSYFYTLDFATNILHTLEQDAIYFPSADHATFPVIYLQAVEGMRPDVTIANKYGYPEEYLYAQMPGRERFASIPNATEERYIEDWIIQNSTRPVYFSARRGMEGLPGYELKEVGLLFRVVRPEEVIAEKDFWEEYTWHSLDESATVGELTADYVLSDIFYMQGRGHLAKGEDETAVTLLDRVAAINPDNKETLNNLGSTCAEHGLLDVAARYLDMALAVDPAYPTALLNLAKVQTQRGNHTDAILKLEDLLRTDGRNLEAVRLSAQCLTAIRWFNEAIERYEYYLRLDSNDADVCRELGNLYLRHKNDSLTASQLYAKSLQLNPDQPELSAELALLSKSPETSAPEIPELPDPFALLPSLQQVPGAPSPTAPTVPMVTLP